MPNLLLIHSKKIKHSFCGYAYAQIKRVENHRRWLLNPPQHKPQATDFGLDETKALDKADLNCFLEFLYLLIRDRVEWMEKSDQIYTLLVEEIDFKGVLKQHPLPDAVVDYAQALTRSSKDFILLLQKSQQYRAALNEWKAYQEWKDKRNPERAGMEMRVGYDAKHVMHSIRLLRMGCEILKDGKIIVNREVAGDADYLRDIRNCKYSYAEVSAESKRLFDEMEVLYQKTTLPHAVNHRAVNDLCITLVEKMGF
ncbi:hypothetical protein ACQ4M3_12900 [Leptolyngbya sp. AN03gr2]|uniref:hypothetical protein n=1 Tax=unclassified Leptolyngbya TaxID=2650499 RepID=UPI003D316F1D